MKSAIAVFLVTFFGLFANLDAAITGNQMKDLVTLLNQLQLQGGGSGTNIGRILTHVVQVLGQASDQQSLFIAGDDGNVYSGGLVGNLIGALLGTVGYILGGENGLCGGAHGLYMQQHQGLLGQILDFIQPITGSLGNGGGRMADNGIISNLLGFLGLGSLLQG